MVLAPLYLMNVEFNKSKPASLLHLLVSYRCCNRYSQSGFKQHKFIVLYFWRSEVRVGLTGLKSRCQQVCVPSGGSRGESTHCLFKLLEATFIAGLLASFSSFQASSLAGGESFSDFELLFCLPF